MSAARRQSKDAYLLAVIENVIALVACPFGTQKESRRSVDIHFFRLWIATPKIKPSIIEPVRNALNSKI